MLDKIKHLERRKKEEILLKCLMSYQNSKTYLEATNLVRAETQKIKESLMDMFSREGPCRTFETGPWFSGPHRTR